MSCGDGLTELPVGPWADPSGFSGLGGRTYRPSKYLKKSTPGFSALYTANVEIFAQYISVVLTNKLVGSLIRNWHEKMVKPL